ncbi:MAG: class I SAM-dependent methyltransferase [Chloroflexi bacterium]|nr:class I SAM-dependent methyltransferase [Chloroflexota bacterium]
MIRIYKKSRLVYYKKKSTAKHWDAVWAKQENSQIYERAKQGDLGYYSNIFPKYLPKTGKVLEAGCGIAQFVLALHILGFDVEGVDYAKKTIARVKSEYPELNIRVGDVTGLDVSDGHYAGYISLGVMEHDESGPEKFLKEAYRILSPGSVALISVPYLNILRRVKAKLGVYQGDHKNMQFYQYVFLPQEFNQFLQAAGFKVVEHFQYSGYKGLVDEFPWLKRLFELPQGWRIKKFLMNWKWAERHMGHMMLYVSIKE